MSKPSFSKPPLVEAAFGFDFRPIAGWTELHAGLFWNRIRNEYPQGTTKPGMERPSELVDSGLRAQLQLHKLNAQLQITNPPLRATYSDPDSGRLLQLQRDSLSYHWTGAGQKYPRYGEIKPTLLSSWDTFTAFVGEEGLGSPTVKQCEVSFVNDIEKGHGWETPAEIANVFTFAASDSTFWTQADRYTCHFSRLLTDKRARVYVNASHAIRHKDLSEVLRLELTVRGPVENEDLGEWFDFAHDRLVEEFCRVTTSSMHERWQREV